MLTWDISVNWILNMPGNRYERLIESIFFEHYQDGSESFVFRRDEIPAHAERLGIELPKNLGDVVYSFRYRSSLPDAILKMAPPGKTWTIRPAGTGTYRFELCDEASFVVRPNEILEIIRIPDSTPGVISMYALGDEQALLAKVRYNRLLDIFSGVTCYSLQSHLRTTVEKLGQVEADEVYVGVGRTGAHYVFPVEAKGRNERLGLVQIEQDIALCDSKFKQLICRPIAAQFIGENEIALFEFRQTEDGVRMVDEKHYGLVPDTEVTAEDLERYRQALPD